MFTLHNISPPHVRKTAIQMIVIPKLDINLAKFFTLLYDATCSRQSTFFYEKGSCFKN